MMKERHRRRSSRLLQETLHGGRDGFIGASPFPAAVGTQARRAARDEIPKRANGKIHLFLGTYGSDSE